MCYDEDMPASPRTKCWRRFESDCLIMLFVLIYIIFIVAICLVIHYIFTFTITKQIVIILAKMINYLMKELNEFIKREFIMHPEL